MLTRCTRRSFVRPHTHTQMPNTVHQAEMPMKPMSAERCAAEGLTALSLNRATHVAGRMNRLMAKLMPRSVATSMMGAMIGKKFAHKALAASAATPAFRRYKGFVGLQDKTELRLSLPVSNVRTDPSCFPFHFPVSWGS